jgi:dihydroorotate dehydrogenase
MVYKGPYLAQEINQGLAGLMKAEGFETIAEAVGTE